jgi:tetratricopeptide (TPR) repeat protein
MKTFAWLATLLFTTCVSAQITSNSTEREAARRFGESIAAAFNERDTEALSALIDLHGFGLRAGKVQGFEGAALNNFVASLEKTGFAQVYASYFQKLDASNGTVKFMRVTVARPVRSLVRLDLGENGYDYMEFVLETRDGRARAVDWFQLSTGDLLSVTAGGVAQMFKTNDTGLLGRLFATDRIDAKALQQLRRSGELQHAGKYAEALVEMRKLPEAMTNSRLLLSAQASLALMSKNDAEYYRVLATLAEKHSDNPAAAFTLIDHYFTIKDRPNMLKALDTMEKRVGVDAVTRNLRAGAYYTTGDIANTLKYADEAIGLEPEFLPAYDLRCSALIGLDRYADAVAQYQSLEKQFGLEFTRDVFEGDPFFEKFVTSKAFRDWLPK